MTTNEKISAIRSAMVENGINVYYIPSSDPHMSEYLSSNYKDRAFVSGFTGSAGTLIITQEESAVWADGRYFIQAAREIEGSEIKLMRMAQPETPTVYEYIADKMPENGVLGINAKVNSSHFVEKVCDKAKMEIKDIDLVSPIWVDRPEAPATEIFALDVKYAGISAKDKLNTLREKIAENDAETMLECDLGSIAWLLNIRASDIAYNPMVISYLYIGKEDAVVFTNTKRMPNEVKEFLAENNVSVKEYEDVVSFIENCEKTTMLIDKNQTNYMVLSAIKNNKNIEIKNATDPVQAMKGTKNPTELACLDNCHIKDGVAMVRFQMRLEKEMAAGNKVTELDIADWLKELRAKQEDNIGESFNTIAAYGANAAMMHYSASESSYAVLEPRGYLLVDSGAQYKDGTTDITRTYALGELTDNERKYYTLVLKGHIDIAKAVFLKGCAGRNLDIMARGPIWAELMDYRCGTGHGVSFVGGVHEGPQRLNQTGETVFEVGMTITDEPGIYEEGEVGIRIENELVCVEKGKSDYGTFLGFETFTYCPIDTTPVIIDMLEKKEIEWLNNFHAKVYETLAPKLTKEEQMWLAEKTAKIG